MNHADACEWAVDCLNGEDAALAGMWALAGQPANINGLVQERGNSSALAMELRLYHTNPSIYAEGRVVVK